jgi:hypothetical protein
VTVTGEIVANTRRFRSGDCHLPAKEIKMNKLVKQAIVELKVDVPVMRSLVNGKKVRLWLYGGRVLDWELKPPRQNPVVPVGVKHSGRDHGS